VLQWKVHRAVIKAKLEPYLGFLHSIQYGKPSLVCDLQELYRHFIDAFVIEFCQELHNKDFTMKTENVSKNRKGKREYLNDTETRLMLKELNSSFNSMVEIPRIKVGSKQSIETLINEEAILFAKYLRNESIEWEPRIPVLNSK
jgi:CRISPR-associated protein Cas1